MGAVWLLLVAGALSQTSMAQNTTATSTTPAATTATPSPSPLVNCATLPSHVCANASVATALGCYLCLDSSLNATTGTCVSVYEPCPWCEYVSTQLHLPCVQFAGLCSYCYSMASCQSAYFAQCTSCSTFSSTASCDATSAGGKTGCQWCQLSGRCEDATACRCSAVFVDETSCTAQGRSACHWCNITSSCWNASRPCAQCSDYDLDTCTTLPECGWCGTTNECMLQSSPCPTCMSITNYSQCVDAYNPVANLQMCQWCEDNNNGSASVCLPDVLTCPSSFTFAPWNFNYDNGGLSTTAKWGIGLGVGAGVSLIGGFVRAIVFRRAARAGVAGIRRATSPRRAQQASATSSLTESLNADKPSVTRSAAGTSV